MSTDDYMPMTIQNPNDYDEVIGVTWSVDERSSDEVEYVTVLLPCNIQLLV